MDPHFASRMSAAKRSSCPSASASVLHCLHTCNGDGPAQPARGEAEGWERVGEGGRALALGEICHATLHHGGVGSSTQTTTDSGRSPWCQEDGDGARVPKIVTQMARNITPAARSHLGDKADRDEVDVVEDVEQDCEPRRWDMGQPHRQPRAREQGV